MSKVPLTTDAKLDLVLAALRGLQITPREIVLSPRDLARLSKSTNALAAGHYYRDVKIREEPNGRSWVAVDLPDAQRAFAPLAPSRFARWLRLPEAWPQPPAQARRQRKAA